MTLTGTKTIEKKPITQITLAKRDWCGGLMHTATRCAIATYIIANHSNNRTPHINRLFDGPCCCLTARLSVSQTDCGGRSLQLAHRSP